MSTNVEEKSKSIDSLFVNFELQFRQLMLESKYNKSIIKTTQDNLSNCLKRNVLLEHQLETECLNKSMIKMKLDSLTAMMNKNIKSNNSEFDLNVSIHEREYLIDKIYNIQVENLQLKQELTKSNNKISLLIENQHKYPEKINLVTSIINSLQQQINNLEKESQLLVNILKTSKILAIKMLSALEYSKKSNEAQFNHFQHLMNEVVNIKGQVHMFIEQHEKLQIIKNDQEKIILSNQTHLEISKKLITILQTENFTLHKSIEQMLDKPYFRNNAE